MIIRFFIAAIFILCFVLPLNATTLTVDESIYGKMGVSVKYKDTTRKNLNVGQLRVTLGTSTEFLPAFCVDLPTPLSLKETYTVLPESPSEYFVNNDNGMYVEWLMDYALSSSSRFRIGTNKDAGAGFQLAIWEVLYDFESLSSNYHLSNNSDDYGNFWYDFSTTDKDIDSWYATYIDVLKTQIATKYTFTYSGKYVVAKLSQNGTDKQDLLIAVVPEPTTLMLLSFGLLGLSAVGRRKKS